MFKSISRAQILLGICIRERLKSSVKPGEGWKGRCEAESPPAPVLCVPSTGSSDCLVCAGVTETYRSQRCGAQSWEESRQTLAACSLHLLLGRDKVGPKTGAITWEWNEGTVFPSASRTQTSSRHILRTLPKPLVFPSFHSSRPLQTTSNHSQ